MHHLSRSVLAVLQLLLLVGSSVVCHAASSSSSSASSWRYAVVIDAGSTGSRAHVFKYTPPQQQQQQQQRKGSVADVVPAYPLVQLPEAVHKTSPGLSAYAFDPQAAANSLQPLLAFARTQVPASHVSQTPIQLMATAGLRMISNDSAAAILKEVDRLLSDSGFAYPPTTTTNAATAAAGGVGSGAHVGARVLSGAEEGLLGWVAVNYASGALQAAAKQQQQQQDQLGRKGGPHPKQQQQQQRGGPPLKGVLELGGGSLQVTFLPPSPPPPAEAAALQLPSLGTGRLYSRSFDGVGLQAAMSRWASDLAARKQRHDPCLPVGLKAPAAGTTAALAGSSSSSSRHGSGDWQACKAGVSKLLPTKGTCAYKLCGLAGSFLPPLGGTTFVGVDNFFYASSTLGLPPSKAASLDDIDRAAAAFCGRSWSHIKSQLLKDHAGDPAQSYHARVCFSAALILGLLGEGLHLPRSTPLLTPSNSITAPDGHSLEPKWPLGALLVGLLQQQQQQQGSSSADSTISITSSSSSISSKSSSKMAVTQPEQANDGSGLSGGSAAALAAAFCMGVLALSLCASWLGVGLPGNGRCGWGAARLYVALLQLLGASAAAVTGGSSGGSGSRGGSSGSGGGGGGRERDRDKDRDRGGASGGVGSGVRYMRVRGGEGSSDVRPTSSSSSTSPPPPSSSTRKAAAGSEGLLLGPAGGSIMLTVLPGRGGVGSGGGGAGGVGDGWATSDQQQTSSAMGSSISSISSISSSAGGSKVGSRTTTARQR